MVGLLKRFARHDGGATAIEYGLIVGLIFLAIVAAMQLFAGASGAMYDQIVTAIDGALS
jgi:pilus assembly protein Flp/PilA